MSKQIKQMEMAALEQTFKGVRDLVVLSVSGLTSQVDNQMRLGLRKKNIRMQVVKNSLARRVFEGMGLSTGDVWAGPTTVAWGSTSVAELSKEIDAIARKNDKTIKVKGAVADGQAVSFELALKMPTKAEAIGRVVMLALAPASRLVGQILGPASQVAGQIKTLREKTEEAPAEGAAPAPAAG
jgi:large subunit ribosomal protein L10